MNEELLNIVNCQYDREHPIYQRSCVYGTDYECKGDCYFVKEQSMKLHLLERINVLRHILPLDILNNQGNDTSKILSEMEDIIKEYFR